MQNTRVRNLFSTILGVGAVAGGLVLSSCEDEFTEENAIRAQQETLATLSAQDDSLSRIGANINYSVTVVAAGKANTGSRTAGAASVDSASVTVVQGGMRYTEPTGKGGVATFAGLAKGKAVVTVEAKDHTSVTFTTTLGSSSGYSEGKENNNVGTLIPVFPTTVAAGASLVSGKAWAELDATNDMPDPAVGAEVRATIDVANALSPYKKSNSNDYGAVETATYEGFVKTATVQEDGTYELIVPNGNGSNGNGILPAIKFMPFTAKQKYMDLQDGQLVEVEKDVLFGSGSVTSHIKTVAGVNVVIEAPTGKAEGFAAEAKLAGQTLDLFSDDIKGGTGYTNGETFEFPADAEGNKASFQVSVINGEITGLYNFEDGNAMYTEMPTAAPVNAESGSGATIAYSFTPLYDIVVTNTGSGYWSDPTVKVAYTPANSASMDVSDRFATKNSDGTVGEKDQVIGSFYSKTVPVVSIPSMMPRQAVIPASAVSISDGEVAFINVDSNDADAGAGYLSSPKVTFQGIGDKGTGAEGIAIVENGKIARIAIINPGTGYSVANDLDHEEFEQQQYSDSTPSPSLTPGATSVGVNFNYGSGAVQ